MSRRNVRQNFSSRSVASGLKKEMGLNRHRFDHIDPSENNHVSKQII